MSVVALLAPQVEDAKSLYLTEIPLANPISVKASALCECYDNVDAILDRLVNGAHRMDLMGDSLRKIK